MDGWVGKDERMDGWVGRIDGWMDGWEGWMDGWVGRMDGWMGGENGRMDELLDSFEGSKMIFRFFTGRLFVCFTLGCRHFDIFVFN